MNPVVIQWTALALCAVGAAVRVPNLRRGQGRVVFLALTLLTVAVGLSIPPIYLAVDAVLGGVNLANLLLRLITFAVMLLLGMRIAAAFGSATARRLVAGPFGLAVLALTVCATLYFFVASELPTSATGLRGFGDQETVQQYAMLGRLYPGYVCACLALPAWAAVVDRRARPIHRVASAFLGTGFLLVVTHVVLRLTPADLRQWDVILPFSGIVLTTTGLCLIWLGHAVLRRKASRTNMLA